MLCRKKKFHGQIHLANWMSSLCLEIYSYLLADKESETSWKGMESLLIHSFPQFLLHELYSTVECHRAMKIDKWLLQDSSYKCNVKWKKPDTMVCILHESIYIKLNNRQKYPMDLKVRMSLSKGSDTTRVLTLLVAVHILFGWRSHCLLCESDWFVHFSAYVYICVILRLREKGKTSKTHQYWRDQKINVHEFGSSKYNVLQKKILQVFWTRFPSSNTKVLENWRSEVWNGFRRVKIKVSQGCVSMFLLEALEENHFLAFSSL